MFFTVKFSTPDQGEFFSNIVPLDQTKGFISLDQTSQSNSNLTDIGVTLVAPKPSQEVLVRGQAGLVIN